MDDDDDKQRNTITTLAHKNDGDDEDDVEDGIVFSVPPKLNTNYDNNKNNNKCDDCESVTTDYKHLYETYKSKSDTLKSELMAKEKLIQELSNSLETVTKQLNHNIMQKRESDFMVRAYEDLERDNDGLRLRVMEIDESKLKVEKTMNECLAALQEKDREMELMKSEKDLKIDELIERLKRLKKDHLILKSFVERVADICGHDNDARNNNNNNADGDDDDYYSCLINEAMVDRLLITLEQKVTKSGQQEVGMGCDNEECLKIKSTLGKNFIEFNNLKFDLSEKLKIIDELKSKIERNEASMELRTQEQIIKNLENKLKSKEDIINELKNDTEIMIGSYKRREILLEEAREAFSQSEESFYNRFEAERDKYVDKIKKLEELVGQGVTESRMNEMKEEMRRMKTLCEKYKNDMMKMRRDFDDSMDKMNDCLESLETENVSLRNQACLLSKDRNSRQEKKKMLKKDVGLLKEKVIQLLRDKESLWRQCEELKDDKMMLSEQLQQQSSSHLPQSSSSHSQQSSSLPPSSQKSSLSSSLPPPPPSSSSSSSLPAEVRSSALSRLMTSLVLQTSEPQLSSLPPQPTSSSQPLPPPPSSSSSYSRWTDGVKVLTSWMTEATMTSLSKTTNQVASLVTGRKSYIHNDNANNDHADDEKMAMSRSNLYDVICIDDVIEASIFSMKNDETNTFLDVIDLDSYYNYNQSLTSPSLSQLPESSSLSLAQTQSSLSSQPSSSSSSWLVKHLEATAGKIIFLPVRMSRDFIDNLHWSFNTHPKGITFSIVFKDEMTSSLTSSVTPTTSQLSSSSSSSSSSSIVTTTATEPSSVQRSSSRHPISTIDVIFPPTKLQSHLKDVVASLVPNKSGMYMFIFDNSFNKVTTKQVNLHLKAVYRPMA